MSADEVEGRYRYEPVERLTPEEIFERRWALTLLERVLRRLRKEFEEAGEVDEFDSSRDISPVKRSRCRTVPYRDVAASLGSTESAVYRLRLRFGKLLRQEITETVAAPQDVEDEMRTCFT